MTPHFACKMANSLNVAHSSSVLLSPHFYRRQALVDFILAHADGDCRPHLEVSILGHPFLGLLDSGSSVTLVSGSVVDKLLKLGLTLKTNNRVEFQVANGDKCTSMGTIATPICLEGRVTVLEVLAVSRLSSSLILGSDFWMAMDVIPDLKRDIWHFGSECIPVSSGIQTGSTLTLNQQRLLEDMLTEKFARMKDGLGYTTLIEHEITLQSDAKPIKQRYYPVSPSKQRLLDEELNKMLKEGIVEPSKSPWSSPALLVPKDGGTKHRFCVDYRTLNAVTKKDAYPLPYISSILDRLKGARFLSSLDIKSAYHQIAIKEESKELTAFTIPGRGLFQFRRMPFGLTNAPATWQRLIDRVIGADLEPYVFVYLDDIIVISPDFHTHLKVLAEVLERLIKAGLTVSREKCHFCRPSLKYLGYVVDSEGLHVDVSKVEAMLNVPPPRNAKEVRRFVGMASWYRRFIPNFATILKPLTELTRKNVHFLWTDKCQESFSAIKNCLVSAPVLTCPDFEKPFLLQTDASAYGIGAVLTQIYPDGERVICFLSRSLSRTEMNYTTTERECLAVIWAIEKLRHFLEGSHFTVITDHSSLLWLHNIKDPTGRLARWALRLQPYDYTIVHRKGREHVVPDFLSRSVPEKVGAIEIPHVVDTFPQTTDRWYLNMLAKVENNPEKYRPWRVNNGLVYKYVRCDIPELSAEENYWKLVVPKDKRKIILEENHDQPKSGHLGVYKTFWRLRRLFTWPSMRADVARYVRNCTTCAQHKPEQKRPAGLMGSRPEIQRPWQMVSLDFMGPFPRSKSGFSYLLVICDYFSKYVLLFPLRSAKARYLVSYVNNHLFSHFGVPEFLICDNGQQMRSKDFQNLCNQHGVKICYTANYLPRADPAERYNRIIKTMISCYIKKDHKSWDENLSAVGCALRTCKSEVTGFCPYYVNFGREYIGDGREYRYLLKERRDGAPPRPANDFEKRALGYQKMFRQINQRLVAAQERNRNVYNLRRRPVNYNIGDLVWRKNRVLSDAAKGIKAGLCPAFIGPYVVRRKVGSWTYELEDEDGKPLNGTWHVQDLKPVVEVEDR